MPNKMSLAELKSFYKEPLPNLPGNPNLHTKATKKNHIHVVNPSAKPSKGLSSHAYIRRMLKNEKLELQNKSLEEIVYG